MSSHRKTLSRKFFVITAVVALALSGGAAVAVAQVSATAKAKAYGFCVNKANGNVRALERNNLNNSVNGKCKGTETKVLVREGTWLPTPVAVPVPKLTVKREGKPTEECILNTTPPVPVIPEYVCKDKP